MKYSKTCECCGHVVTAYTLPMNEGLVRAFVTFATFTMMPAPAPAIPTNAQGYRKGDLGLSNSQYANFQNLRHFGLIFQREKGNEWFLTQLGINFYLGRATILTPAGHMGGDTLPPDHPAWLTHKIERRRITIRDVLPEEWKLRPEFQKEKSGQLTFA